MLPPIVARFWICAAPTTRAAGDQHGPARRTRDGGRSRRTWRARRSRTLPRLARIVLQLRERREVEEPRARLGARVQVHVEVRAAGERHEPAVRRARRAGARSACARSRGSDDLELRERGLHGPGSPRGAPAAPARGLRLRPRRPARRRAARARATRLRRPRPARAAPAPAREAQLTAAAARHGVHDLLVARAAAERARERAAHLVVLRHAALRLAASSAAAVTSMPGVHMPHCAAPPPTNARCSAASRPPRASPSTVTTFAPSA